MIRETLIYAAVTLDAQATQGIVAVGQSRCRAAIKRYALRQQTPLFIVAVLTLQYIRTAVRLAVAFSQPDWVAREIIEHVNAAQSPQTVVLYGLDNPPPIVVILRAGLPDITAQYPCPGCCQLSRHPGMEGTVKSRGRHKIALQIESGKDFCFLSALIY